MRMTSRLLCIVALALGMVSFEGGARAASTPTTFLVQATIGNTCTITATALNFGVYDPTVVNAATPLTGSSTVTVTCTKSDALSIDLDNGLHGAATQRNMAGVATPANVLSYELYSDAARSVAWGSTSGGAAVSATGTGAAQALTVYGSVDAAQNLPADTYKDTVTATVTF